VQPPDAASQGTIGGGGRYDNLVEELGGKPTPAIGFAAGIERVILNLKRQGIAVPPLSQPRVFIASAGEQAKEKSISLAAQLRQAGIGVIAATGSKSLKAQMRQANSLGIRHAVIIGEEELKTGAATVRDMTDSTQKSVPMDSLAEFFK
jgi:histidyl-tRNA synthetase